MPRNGSGVMSWPPNTNAVSTQVVASAPYNAFLADLLSDLNAARPITAGGTGGVTAIGGNDALNTQSTAIASAATTDLSTATGTLVNITGTAAITSFGIVPAGAERVLIFAGALTLTYNAASLILPTAANITTVAGDVVTMRSLGGGNWKCVDYLTADGRFLGAATVGAFSVTGKFTAKTGTNPDSTGQPAGTFAAVVYNATNGAGQSGLLVKNNWAANTSTVFEVGLDTVGGAYSSYFKVDGSGAVTVSVSFTVTGPATFNGTVNFTGAVSGLKLQKSFESAATAYAAGSAVTFAHGLGAAPKLYYIAMQCVTADSGYAIGDEIIANPGTQGSGGSNYGVTVQADATNIYARIGSNGVPALNKTTFASAVLNTSNWRLVARAWL